MTDIGFIPHDDPKPNGEQRRRAEDMGRLVTFWNWVDDRDIDKHAVSLAILWGTWKITEWSMAYASAATSKSGIEVAAVIAAVSAPYMALQGYALKQYFEARK